MRRPRRSDDIRLSTERSRGGQRRNDPPRPQGKPCTAHSTTRALFSRFGITIRKPPILEGTGAARWLPRHPIATQSCGLRSETGATARVAGATLAWSLLSFGSSCVARGARIVERKHGEHATLSGEAAGIAKRTECAESCRRVFRADTGRDADPRPATDP